MGILRVALIGLCIAATGCGNSTPKVPTVSELNTMLQSNDPEAQVSAAHTITQLGPKAAETVPALIAALKSPDLRVRSGAATALGAIGADNPQVVPALIQTLDQDDNFAVRTAAASALGNLGPAASTAVPALERYSSAAKDNGNSGCDAGADALKKVRR